MALFQEIKIKSLIADVRHLYDVIIIDSPPIFPDPTALLLSEHVDLVILASRYDTSRYPTVAAAKRLLSCAPSIGVVLNGYGERWDSPPSFLASATHQ